MTDAIWLALIGGGIGLLSSALLAYLTNWSRRQEKELDWARQDEVEKRAKESADIVAKKAAEVAQKLNDNNAQVSQKLDIIHTLVNSNMTAAMKAELDATTRELAMMYEVVELKKAQGQAPNVETLATIEATKYKISELSAALADRTA